MYELTLSPQEIQDLTRYKRYTKQQYQLRCHGIPFTPGPNNEPIVLRRDVQAIREPLNKLSEYVSTEPNFGALENGTTSFK
ncbi:DUF4224 domain-containing protein [Citrobacter freundii]|uniref:DUF4224 domain-containing protein n=1 Tax=Citrobacter freundii TaxID=546 RepID=UPI0015E95069|nr:DUF4224 domain-containing protein [Citrobacter freundii]QLZ60527.1 DUF4224 domain-containing protein [Citrobacter freundii]